MGKDIPLLIGSTLNEWNFFPNQSVQPTAELEAAVRAAYPNKPELTADRVDSLIRLPMLKIMSHKADQGGATMLLDDTSELVHHYDEALMKLLAPNYEY